MLFRQQFLYLFALYIITLARLVHAYPVVQVGSPLDTEQPLDSTVEILADSQDENLYYIPPTRVDIAKTPDTLEPLFRLSVSKTSGTADLYAVVFLGFDLESVKDQWNNIKKLKPDATLAPLPIEGGEFGLELRTDEFKLLIGQASVVQHDLAAAMFPLYIKIHQTGVLALRALSDIEGADLFTLTFRYLSKRILTQRPFSISFNPYQLLEDMISDPRLIEIWQHHAVLSDYELYHYLIKAYARNLWNSSLSLEAGFSVRESAVLFKDRLTEYYSKTLSDPEFDIRRKADLEAALTRIDMDKLDSLRGFNSAGPTVIQDTAGLTFRNICRTYSSFIYTRENGIQDCLALVPQAEGAKDNESDGYYDPFAENSDAFDDLYIPF